MEHTPGPWVVKFQPRKRETISYTDKYWHDQWVIKGPDKKHSPVALVRVEGFGMGPSKAVRKANANLIAAAPDMLAACEEMAAQLGGGNNFAKWEAAKAKLIAAIAKAKGQP